MDRRIVAAEITFGLMMCTVYRLSRDLFQLNAVSWESPRQAVTRSVVSAWTASNVKFLLLCWGQNSGRSLSTHYLSRLTAFGALWLTHCFERNSIGMSQVDVVVCAFFTVSALVLLSLDLHNRNHKNPAAWLEPVSRPRTEGQDRPISAYCPPRNTAQVHCISRAEPHRREAKPGMNEDVLSGWLVCHFLQRLLLQTDRLVLLSFGLLWLVYPDWLLGQDNSLDDPYLTRALGAMMVGDSCVWLANHLLSWETLSNHTLFPLSLSKHSVQPEVHQPVFINRAVGCVALLIYLLTSCTLSHAPICVGLLGASVWTGNSILGYLRSGEGNPEYFVSFPTNGFEKETDEMGEDGKRS